MKIASIVGARPNFIKLAPLSKRLREMFEEIIIHTGQHYDYEMDRIFFEELGIPAPDYHLNAGSGSHGLQTGEMLRGIEEVLLGEKPAAVVVFGDTNTTLAGALSAAKLNIPVVHVESGLRSYDRKMPEEVNRVLVDHCSDLLFCPTNTAVKNLHLEGVVEGVYLTGDVMVDILNECVGFAEDNSQIIDDLGLSPGGYRLVTFHRAENTDQASKLKSIVQALIEIGKSEEVILPCHPRTENRLKMEGLWKPLVRGVRVVKPVGYTDMLVLEKNAFGILTDSGGVQKEAYLLGVACVTMRQTTEWVETVDDGWNILVGTDTEKIVWAARNFRPRRLQRNVFGDGTASQRIMDVLRVLDQIV